MPKSDLDKARSLLKKRQFTKIINLLEPKILDYRDSFQFYYILGLSCLYSDDIKGAHDYFTAARKIKINDVNLIMAQAVLYLKRGAIDKAVDYCIDVLMIEPQNEYANRFLDTVKNNDRDTLSEWNHNGKIKFLYPPLPKRNLIFPFVISAAVALVLILCAVFIPKLIHINDRIDRSKYEVAKEDMLDKSMRQTTYRYILTQSQSEEYYRKAQNAVNDYDDNLAQVYINIIKNANCSEYLISKVKMMEGYLTVPSFDEGPKTNFSYTEVSKDCVKYRDCYVIWTGRVTNIDSDENETRCTLLVGYEDFKKKEGDARLVLSREFELRPDKPVKVLAQIATNAEGELVLLGKSVYQPIKGENL